MKNLSHFGHLRLAGMITVKSRRFGDDIDVANTDEEEANYNSNSRNEHSRNCSMVCTSTIYVDL